MPYAPRRRATPRLYRHAPEHAFSGGFLLVKMMRIDTDLFFARRHIFMRLLFLIAIMLEKCKQRHYIIRHAIRDMNYYITIIYIMPMPPLAYTRYFRHDAQERDGLDARDSFLFSSTAFDGARRCARAERAAYAGELRWPGARCGMPTARRCRDGRTFTPLLICRHPLGHGILPNAAIYAFSARFRYHFLAAALNTMPRHRPVAPHARLCRRSRSSAASLVILASHRTRQVMAAA